MGRLIVARRRRASALLALTTALLVQLTGVVSLSPAHAASILWTLSASPLTATTGVQRVFTLTATNEDPLAALLSGSEIGCVVLTVPGNFVVAGAAVTGSSTGGSWHVDSVASNVVTVHTDSGGDRLALLDWVRFTVTATPHSTGSLAWQARAFRQQDCSGSAALLGVPPVVVVTAPAPTPVPTPASTPTPRPTPTATPILPLPSLPLPSLPLPTPRPSEPAPTPTPRPTSSPTDRPSESPRPTSSADPDGSGSPRPSPSADPDGSGSPVPTPGGGSPVSGGEDGSNGAPVEGGGSGGSLGPLTPEAELPPSAPRVQFDEGQLGVGGIDVDLLADFAVWSVPAATLGVPGVILIVWVALQAVGALAWIPAVRSLRGEG